MSAVDYDAGMKDIRRGLQWLALAGGVVACFFGGGNSGGAGGPIMIAGSILAGCALVAMAIDRD
jgi:hypothetical protein